MLSLALESLVLHLVKHTFSYLLLAIIMYTFWNNVGIKNSEWNDHETVSTTECLYSFCPGRVLTFYPHTWANYFPLPFELILKSNVLIQTLQIPISLCSEWVVYCLLTLELSSSLSVNYGISVHQQNKLHRSQTGREKQSHQSPIDHNLRCSSNN